MSTALSITPPTLAIGTVARAVGVSPSLIRKLEFEGALPAPLRSLTGHRQYRAEDIAVIREIVTNRARVLAEGRS